MRIKQFRALIDNEIIMKRPKFKSMSINFLSIIFALMTVTIDAKTAPDYLDTHVHFTNNSIHNNTLNRIIHRRFLDYQTSTDISFSHQNREWGYNWMAGGLTVPTGLGLFSFGFMHYGTNRLYEVIEVGQNQLDFGQRYPHEHNTIAIAYQPKISRHYIQFLARHIITRLHQIRATASGIDVAFSSDDFLNNQVGIRTLNLISTDYQWNTSRVEPLVKYIGVFGRFSYAGMKALIEQDISLNYTQYWSTYLEASYAIGNILKFHMAYRFPTNDPTFKKYFTVGNSISLTKRFMLDISYQREFAKFLDDEYYGISIGVTI